jgi:chromosome partitioning protein
MTQIITISNHKGGVGKTTTAAHLAQALSLLNKNVLLLDFDPQANLTTFFNVPKSDAASYLLTLGLGAAETDLIQSLVVPLRERVQLLPASAGLSGAQAQINAAGKGIDWVRQALERFLRYDLHYIIIDTNPSASGIQERAVWAADLLIIPSQAEALSVSGIGSMLKMTSTLREQHNWPGRVLGVLPTMVRADGSNFMPREHRAALEEMRQSLGDLLLPVVPDRAAVKECAGKSQTLFEFDPENPAALAYRQLAKLIRSAQA